MNEITRAGILLNAAGIPFKIFEKLYKNYSPEDLYKGEEFWNELGMTFPQQKKLSEILLKSSWPEEELERVENFNARFITAFDIDYPARLKDLKNPPVGLYVKGNADLNFPSAAIVGTRKCSSYGENIARSLAKALARAGIIVISGGARGIDTAAHRGCLSENGITFSIFGTGLDKIYPVQNRDLFERILERGALISEYPMGTGGNAWRFPERNRIISGMAGRTIVVETPENGGAMITAKAAKELGRDLWSVPGRINEEVSAGTNRLIQDKAGVLLSIEEFINQVYGDFGQLRIEIEDIEDENEFEPELENKEDKFKEDKSEFENFKNKKSSSDENIKNKSQPVLSDEEKIIFGIIQRQGNRTVDTIMIESGLDLSTVQGSISMLDIMGLIIQSGPGRYSASA